MRTIPSELRQWLIIAVLYRQLFFAALPIDRKHINLCVNEQVDAGLEKR